MNEELYRIIPTLPSLLPILAFVLVPGPETIGLLWLGLALLAVGLPITVYREIKTLADAQQIQ